MAVKVSRAVGERRRFYQAKAVELAFHNGQLQARASKAADDLKKFQDAAKLERDLLLGKIRELEEKNVKQTGSAPEGASGESGADAPGAGDPAPVGDVRGSGNVEGTEGSGGAVQ